MADLKIDPHIRANALEQIKRRIVTALGWPNDDPRNDEVALRLFRRGLAYARYYHRLHKWDNLPRLEEHPLDADMHELLGHQDWSTITMVQNEHKMTLVTCFLAIGIDRTTADPIVEYIIAKDKQDEESE